MKDVLTLIVRFLNLFVRSAIPLVLAGLSAVGAEGAASRKPRRPSAPLPPVPLVWYVETLEGQAIDARDSESPINPASVVKVATTLWALDALGPEFRFETRFLARGRIDAATGVLHGDLVVQGDGDPDFQLENAWLVARALNDRGIREVRGKLVVDDRFWIGWEGGSDRSVKDPARRRALMASRLRDALDSQRWGPTARRAMSGFTARRGLARIKSPRVWIHSVPPTAKAVAHVAATGVDLERRDVGLRPGSAPDNRLIPLVLHRSNPLARTLKRFNAFSNNDIERLEASLGPPVQLAKRLTELTGSVPSPVILQTLSGLGQNRLTARQVVRMLRGLSETCSRWGLRLSDVLPVVGCDPGTLTHLRKLKPADRAITAKTGTLTSTDGGVAVLAGLVSTGHGERVFCVAAPNSGAHLDRARTQEQEWLMAMIGGAGGPKPGSCGASVGHSDDAAEALFLNGEAPGELGTR